MARRSIFFVFAIFIFFSLCASQQLNGLNLDQTPSQGSEVSCREIAEIACKGKSDERCKKDAFKLCLREKVARSRVRSSDCIGRAIEECGVGNSEEERECRRKFVRECEVEFAVKRSYSSFAQIYKLVEENCECKKGDEDCENKCKVRKLSLLESLHNELKKKNGCKLGAIKRCGVEASESHNKCRADFVYQCQIYVNRKRELLSKLAEKCKN